jgi:hypothetical protein
MKEWLSNVQVAVLRAIRYVLMHASDMDKASDMGKQGMRATDLCATMTPKRPAAA